jgi:hypothetical protein
MTRERDTALGARSRVLAWLAWFAALNLLWLLLISAWVVEEEILGVFAAALAATAAEAVREQGVAGFRPRARWLRRAPVLPWAALRESSLVLGALARHVSGRGPAQGGSASCRLRSPTTQTSKRPRARCLLQPSRSHRTRTY